MKGLIKMDEKELLQAIEIMIDKKLEPINKLLEKLDIRLDKIDDMLDSIKIEMQVTS